KPARCLFYSSAAREVKPPARKPYLLLFPFVPGRRRRRARREPSPSSGT
uniref:Uncharacterized protein n=1 Tax=Aegilops tauschii subsp. strangulata TaxID=200361 RepID=A0A453AQ42_AEGTS